MATGTPGTGPYAKIRRLRHEIKDCLYELKLIANGMRRKFRKRKLTKMVKDKRAQVKKILAKISKK